MESCNPGNRQGRLLRAQLLCSVEDEANVLGKEGEQVSER